MKIKHTKGMRDIPTIQGLNSRSVPDTRQQAATELARLEHEKARLERNLKMWINNQKKTEGRLRQVEERLALVQQVLVLPAADGSPKCVQARRSLSEESNGSEGKGQGWREITLEY